MNKQHRHIAALADFLQVQELEKLNDQEFWEYAASRAATPPARSVQIDTFLECATGAGRIILPLELLRKVLPPPHRITLFPAMPAWMAGITGWHSEILPVVDLNAYLTQQPACIQSEHMLLIVQDNDLLIGLLVTISDSILEITNILPADTQRIERYPQSCPGAILGVYNEALLLDMQVILTDMVQQIKNDSSI